MLSEKHTYDPLHDGDDASEAHLDGLKEARLWRFRCLVISGFFLASLATIGVLLFKEANLGGARCISLKDTGVEEPYSPATDQIEYINRYLSRDPETHRFMGKPRPELDEAWHELLNGTMIRITDEELQMADNATSIRHKDGGYVAGLGISHSLHCLKRLKQYLHPDYYYSSPNQDWEELESHADHCLEGLRQSIMCQADLSVYTLEWTPHSRFKPAVRVPQPHKCVNWDRLHEWMEGRLAKNDDMVPAPPELYENAA